MDSYTKEDADFYFGRDTEVEKLYNQVFNSNLLMIYGTSATGKTSLVQCGLGNMFEDTDWLPIFIRKGENIIESLEEVIHQYARRKPKKGTPIQQQLHSLYLDYYKPVFLIFDQFEELFILGDSQEEEDFFWWLTEILQSDIQVKILLIMREEYLAHLDRFEEIIPTLFENRFRVERMRREQIEEVIRGTSEHERFNIEIENEEVIQKIIENVQNDKGHLNLADLQVYLDRLYRNDLRNQRVANESRKVIFNEDLLKKTGKLDDVLSLFLDEQLFILDNNLRAEKIWEEGLVLSILSELITNNETKVPREIDEIKASLKRKKNIESKSIDFCIQRLREMRILRELA